MFEILDFRQVGKNSLVATFSVKCSDLKNQIIRKMSYFKKENGESWVSYPCEIYEKNGKKKYFSYIKFENQEVSEIFLKKTKEALEEFIKKNYPQTFIQKELPMFHNLETNNEVPF